MCKCRGEEVVKFGETLSLFHYDGVRVGCERQVEVEVLRFTTAHTVRLIISVLYKNLCANNVNPPLGVQRYEP